MSGGWSPTQTMLVVSKEALSAESPARGDDSR